MTRTPVADLSDDKYALAPRATRLARNAEWVSAVAGVGVPVLVTASTRHAPGRLAREIARAGGLTDKRVMGATARATPS